MGNSRIAVIVNNKAELIRRFPELRTEPAEFCCKGCGSWEDNYTGEQLLSWNYCPFCGTEVKIQSVDIKDASE